MKNNNQPILLEMKGITKRFPGVVANDNIDFQLKAGEVHALLGENGAGKTTLMNILYGLYKQDEGEIYIKGQRVDIKNPKHAIQLGIGMVHQHFMLVDVFSVIVGSLSSIASRSFSSLSVNSSRVSSSSSNNTPPVTG